MVVSNCSSVEMPDDLAWRNLYEWTSQDSVARSLLTDVTLFKAAHHGRMSSYCGSEFLEIINPQQIIVSSDNVLSDESAKRSYRNYLTTRGSGELYRK